MKKLLEVKDLTIRFNTDEGLITAVEGVSFSLQPNEILGIVGESGSGKSVMAKSIMDLNANNTVYGNNSQILFNSNTGKLVEVLSLPTEGSKRLIRGGEVSMIFQEPMASFAPAITIGKQMIEQIMIHTNMNKKQARELAIELLVRVQMSDPSKRIDQYAFELSGGMRQRAMIAMALSNNPRLLIADEPTTALDVIIQDQVLELMKEIQGKFGMSIILISHDLGVISKMSDRIGVMYLGKMVELGVVKDVINRPAHPYTRGLIATIPDLDNLDVPLKHIPGDIPGLLERPSGCVFHTRCLEMTKECKRRCSSEVPSYYEKSEQHFSACFLDEK